MTNINKIVKYGLENEVDPLLDQGWSLEEIVETIKSKHTDIIDLNNLSIMCIMRYRDSRKKKDIEKSIDEGKDPLDEFVKEYRKALKDLNNKAESLYNKASNILDRVELKNDDNLSLKAVKEVRDSLDQLRKNWVSLAQYGVRQTSNIYNINLKKEQNIKVLLLKFSNELCLECKKKISSILDKEEE